MGVRPFTQLAPYSEGGEDGRIYQEVNDALTGQTASAERVDDQNKLVLSVAVPIASASAPSMACCSSPPKAATSTTFCARSASPCSRSSWSPSRVMLLSSLYLAGTIAEPVRRLAAAADLVRFGSGGRDAIPGFPERNDEIGDLADSLKAMTAALYDRIDAIESFAADVAHELKNPLTSLACAMEMLVRAPDEATRAAADGARARRREAHRPADHRHFRRLAAGRGTVARGPQPVDLSHLLEDHRRDLSTSPDRGKNVAVTLARRTAAPAPRCWAATKGWARCSAT